MGTQHDNWRHQDRVSGKNIAPGVVRLLVDGGMDGALESKVMREGRITHGSGVGRGGDGLAAGVEDKNDLIEKKWATDGSRRQIRSLRRARIEEV